MSVYPIEANFLRNVEIKEVLRESPLIKTFLFEDRLCSKTIPGQFVMVWLPGFDEIPMSISSTTPPTLASITVSKVGKATTLLHKKRWRDTVGIRGPFGNSFKPVKGKVLLIGGGTGIAPVAFLAERLVEAEITFLGGAKTKNELIWLTKIKKLVSKSHGRLISSTEDGSYGHKGVVTELVEEILATEEFNTIYTCGKELMILKIFNSAKECKTPLQASLERLMRCAIGVCGSCTIGKYRVCADGPIFTSEQLCEVEEEFGKFKRGFDGRHLQI